MPIYEYRCEDCGKKSSFLLLSIQSDFKPYCQHCGSHQVVRLVSRIAVLRSEESRLESLADPSKLSDLDENDPRSIGRWMKKFGREMGEELGPEFNEEIDRAIEQAEKSEQSKKAKGKEADSSFSEAEIGSDENLASDTLDSELNDNSEVG
ncbi:MAG: FmdB family zinc ribbon protein [Candidatus Saccharicenans sp.]|nr:MAG: FmdB family transcriptional regulator [Candidatus Aminicenantes bacterium]HEK85440.1 zinc ribbon domain-containing protein [Candidatus Aminicenantes bacterium]